VFGEVMEGQGDFCALVASRGTAAIFEKARCTHLKSVNKPNFDISPAYLEVHQSSRHREHVCHSDLG
jgi:hypothetical protein